MGLLDQLMAGGADRDRYDDFARRYDKGRPHEGYDDDEVAGHYGRLQGDLDDDTYESSARDAYSRMDPDDRRQFKKQLHQAARDRGHRDLDGDGIPDDPESMARYTNQVRRRDPDLLTSMLGGGGGMGGMGGMGGGGMGGAGALGSVLGGAMGGGGGGGNPLARAALAGITAMAAKKMMSR
jgi:hypothetical protein